MEGRPGKNSTIRDHINSAKHKKMNEKPVLSIQKTVVPSFTDSEERSNSVKNFVRMCLESNIPIEKASRMSIFLKKIL